MFRTIKIAAVVWLGMLATSLQVTVRADTDFEECVQTESNQCEVYGECEGTWQIDVFECDFSNDEGEGSLDCAAMESACQVHCASQGANFFSDTYSCYDDGGDPPNHGTCECIHIDSFGCENPSNPC